MAQKKKPNWGYFASLALSVGLALAAGAIIMWAAGYNPVEAYGALLQGATGCDTIGEFFTELFTKRQFGNTLEYTMVLALTGLACALGARAGIFNVGGEGQLYLGAIVSAYIGVLLSGCSAWLAIPAAALGAMAVGGAYAWIPGVLKVKLKVNEVITTIMLNSIAIYFCAYLSTGPWKTSQGNRVSGTDTLDASFQFTRLIKGSSLSTAIFAAAVIALLVWYVMSKTATGYSLKMTGQNRRFAFFSGLKVDTLTIGAMTISGAMCGLVGMFEVYGLKGNYQDGISNEFYFDGLLVAMIMRYSPVGIIFMSILFAVLRIGASGMELNAGVPGELYRIIQSVIIFFMAAQSGISAAVKAKRAEKKARQAAKARLEVKSRG
ncbi:MAG TPA: ABC transporter permease [Candidatus Faecousia faecigallinarum]|nr:ABC transporter permease [Candidatus Faecousia faecigallinarum]